MARFFSFWRNLLRRDRVEQDLDDEVRATLEILADEKVRAGMTPQDARRAAALELGGAESLKQQVREARTGALIETLLQDLRYGWRMLCRNPLFALTAGLSLAIGIGATTTVFTVANGLLLRAAAGVADADRLVDIVRLQRGDTGVDEISYPDFLEVRRRSTTLDEVYAYRLQLDPVSLRTDDTAQRVFASVVSINYFRALGVRAAAGRLFGAGESEDAGAAPVAVLSHRFWTRNFNARSDAIGRLVRVNGHPFTIVGVASAEFNGTSVLAPDIWIPTSMIGIVQAESGTARLTSRESDWLMLGGRLKPGIPRAQASAEMKVIGEALAREFPIDRMLIPPWMPADLTYDWSAERASPIPAGLRSIVAMFLALLTALVVLVLAIACANVAGILLTRGVGRRREIAVRSAIGAHRTRVLRQLLTETTLLFVVSGVIGLAVARVLTSVVTLLLPQFALPVNLSLPLDARVVLFSMSVCFIAAILSGIAPALDASKVDVVVGLKDDAMGGDTGRMRRVFVVAQVALSVLLVVLAGVLAGGLARATSVDRGFDPRGVDIAAIDLSMAGYTAATGPAFAHELLERVRRLPGVEYATFADRAPGPGTMTSGTIIVPGFTPPPGAPEFVANWARVESGYFATLRIPLLAGRDFTESDRAGSEPVAIISENAAQRFWSGRGAIGQTVLVQTGYAQAPNAAPPVAVRVVGVARAFTRGGGTDTAQRRNASTFDFYVPWQQRYSAPLTILVRRTGDASRAAELRALIAGLDPNLPVLSAQTMESLQNGPVETQLRISAIVAGSVGLVGLLLATIGVHGVTAHAVARRTREIGIRLALGAAQTEVMALILRQGMVLVMIGCAVGLALGAAAGRLLSRSPLQVTAPDARLFAAAAALFAVIGLIACCVPVRRAMRIHATEALRYE